MIRKLFFAFICLFFGYLLYLFYPVLMKKEPLLVINTCNQGALPKNFRSTSNALSPDKGPLPSLIGLKELQASGSGQFSLKELETMIEFLAFKTVTIVDLRQESHGFINGTAVSFYAEKNWANKGKNLSQIVENEHKLLKNLHNFPIVIAYAHKTFPIPFWIKSIHSEDELCLSHNLGYMRIPVTDHLRPTDTDVDEFVRFIKSLPKELVWLHFHCAEGKGRTTTFLTMYDMMRNASTVSIEDIFLRQFLLGGINFSNDPDVNSTKEKKLWKKEQAIERLAFLKKFYQYCQENPLLENSWTFWLLKDQ